MAPEIGKGRAELAYSRAHVMSYAESSPHLASDHTNQQKTNQSPRLGTHDNTLTLGRARKPRHSTVRHIRHRSIVKKKKDTGINKSGT